jgi:hypothetical protein
VPVASQVLNTKTRKKREGEWMKVSGVQIDVPHVENGTEDSETKPPSAALQNSSQWYRRKLK